MASEPSTLHSHFLVISGYAHSVHSDTHPESADGAFAFIAMGEGRTYTQGRYLYLNLWRSIDDEKPVLGDHLAMVDQTSLTHGVGSEVQCGTAWYSAISVTFGLAIFQVVLYF